MSVLAGWSQLAWFLVVAVAWTAAVWALPLDPDYTAGEMLDHLVGWVTTGVLYPALGEGPVLRVLNYPPLVLLPARGLVALGFTPLVAGRLVGTLGLVTLAGTVYAWARGRGVRGGALAGTVGLLGASFGVIYGAGQFHIELWAVALTAAGYALLGEGRSSRSAVLGGLVLALACFAKQAQVVPALVALAWSWRYRRQAAPRATAVFAGAGVVGSLAITAAWGMTPWRHMVLYTVGTYSLENLGLQLLAHVAPWLLLLAFAVREVVRCEAVRKADIVVWYGVGAAAWALSSARLGSGYPYFLDLQVAAIVWVGPRVFELPARSAWAWALTAQIVGLNLGVAAAATVAWMPKWKIGEELAQVCALFPPRGPVLTEEAGLARACGRTPVLHPFILASLADRGFWDPGPLESRITGGVYGAAVLPFDPRNPGRIQEERWTRGAVAAFRNARSVTPAPGGLWVAEW